MHLLASNGKLISRAEQFILVELENKLIKKYGASNVASAAHLDEATMKITLMVAIMMKTGEVYRAERDIDATLLMEVEKNKTMLDAVAESVAVDIANAITADKESRQPHP